MKRLLISLSLAVIVVLAVIAITTNVFSSGKTHNRTHLADSQTKPISKNDFKSHKTGNAKTVASHENKPVQSSTTTTTATQSSVTTTIPSKKTAAGIKGQKVLFAYSGTKSIITPNFTVPSGGWNIKYSYDCNPTDSLLQLVTYQGGQIDINDLAPNIQNQGVGKGISVYYVDNGSFNLHVADLGCKKWSVTVITK